MSGRTKQVLYDDIIYGLENLDRDMTELMTLFEEDENLHDMSSVEDRRKVIQEELASWEIPNSMFITTEII